MQICWKHENPSFSLSLAHTPGQRKTIAWNHFRYIFSLPRFSKLFLFLNVAGILLDCFCESILILTMPIFHNIYVYSQHTHKHQYFQSFIIMLLQIILLLLLNFRLSISCSVSLHRNISNRVQVLLSAHIIQHFNYSAKIEYYNFYRFLINLYSTNQFIFF